MGNDLVLSERLPVASVSDIATLGQMVATSGMFGQCTPGRGAVIAAIIQQTGMSFLDFKTTYHVTDKGDLSMRADRMLAEFQRRGGKWIWKEWSDTAARAVASFGENQDVELSYTIEDAKRAGLVKPGGNYDKTPANMLRARLVTNGVGMLCPGAKCGTYTPEELADLYGIDVDEVEGTGHPTPGKTPVPVANTAERVAAVTTPWGTPDSPIETDYFDYEICPVPGKMKGVRWDAMDLDTLRIAMSLDVPEMENDHRAAIQSVIDAKEKAQ